MIKETLRHTFQPFRSKYFQDLNSSKYHLCRGSVAAAVITFHHQKAFTPESLQVAEGGKGPSKVAPNRSK